MDAKNFKVGQKWKRRDGSVAKIGDIYSTDEDHDWPVRDTECNGYSRDGFYYGNLTPHSHDLVELVEDVARDVVDEVPPAIPTTPAIAIPSVQTLALLRKQANHFNQMAVERSEEIQSISEQRDVLNQRIGELQVEFDQFIKAKDETRAFVDSITPAIAEDGAA